MSKKQLLKQAEIVAANGGYHPPLVPIAVCPPPAPAVPATVVKQANTVLEHLYRGAEGQLLSAVGQKPEPMNYGELLALLYAGNFPKEQWAHRVMEALKGARL